MDTYSLKQYGAIRSFFLYFWRCLHALNTIFFSLIAALIIVLFLFVFLNYEGVKIPKGGALVLNPSGTLVEQENEVQATAVLQDSDIPLHTLMKDLIDAITLAKNDNKIDLIVLELDKLEEGLLPKLERIASTIEFLESLNDPNNSYVICRNCPILH